MRHGEFLDLKVVLDISEYNANEYVTSSQLLTLYKHHNFKNSNNAKLLNFLEIPTYFFLKNEKRHSNGIKRYDYNTIKTFLEETENPIEYIDNYINSLNPNVVFTITNDKNRLKVVNANGDTMWFDKLDEIKIKVLMQNEIK